MKKQFYFGCAVTLAFGGLLGCTKASSYEDCVIEGVKSVTVPTVVGAVKEMCKAKFPEAKGVEMEFNSEMLSNITGKAEVKGSLIQGDIYHSNKDWVITHIVIAVYPSQVDGFSQEAISKVSKLYAYDLKLTAFKQDVFAINISSDHLTGSSWGIVSAKGILKDSLSN